MEPIDLTSFLGLVAQGFNVVPFSETLQLDRETPVSLYQRFSPRAIFLLESAALGEATGRYSFIGLDRRWRVSTHDGATVVEGTDGGDPSLAPLDALRQILARYRTHTPRNLPDFFGGAVGFVTYDYVRRLEHLPREAVANMWPDVDFSFPGAVLICDHVQHSTTAVVNVVSGEGEDATTVFGHAREQLQAIIDLLLGPEPSSDPATERLVATAPSQRARIAFERPPGAFQTSPPGPTATSSNGPASTSSPATSFRSCRVNSSSAPAPSIPSPSIACCAPSIPRPTCTCSIRERFKSSERHPRC